MDRGAWWATDHGVTKSQDTTEHAAHVQKVSPGHPLAGRGRATGGTKFLAHAPGMRSAGAEAPAVDLDVPEKQRMRECTRCRRRGEPDDSEI